jgi:hypothetical protein
MPALRQSPPPAQPWARETPPPAPHLTSDNLCSACRVRPLSLRGGDLKVCPSCYALLWHADWSAAENERKAQLNLQRVAAGRERREANLRLRRERQEQRRALRTRDATADP